jgi:hypothetical protein
MCALGQGCKVASDCQSNACGSSGKCVMLGSCVDSVKNGTETDTDCGGSCPACVDGKACTKKSDCSSNQCVTGLCVRQVTFQSAQSVSACSVPINLTVGDLNADGKSDIVVSCSSVSLISVLLGVGDGTFQAPMDTPTPPVAGSFDMVLTQLNKGSDTNLDLLHVTSGNVSSYLGDGNGAFPAIIPVTMTGSPFGAAAGDITGDGFVDIVIADPTAGPNGQMRPYKAIGDGTFSALSTLTAYHGPTGAALGDLNNDGKLDIISHASNTSEAISWWLGTGTGTFGARSDLSQSSGQSFAIATADLDADGKLDVVVAKGGSSSVDVFRGNGDGTLKAAANYFTPGPHRVTLADLNGDGKTDIITTSALNFYVYVSILLNKGDGTFNSPLYLDVPAEATGVGAGDFNGDGKIDIVAAVPSQGTLSLFLNTSP